MNIFTKFYIRIHLLLVILMFYCVTLKNNNTLTLSLQEKRRTVFLYTET